MNIKDKIKSVWNKGRARFARKTRARSEDGACGDDACDIGGKRDAELGADEVLREEVFPEKTDRCRKNCGCPCVGSTGANVKEKGKASSANKKPASKRSRPTNGNYRMIDPSNDTFDAGQS